MCDKRQANPVVSGEPKLPRLNVSQPQQQVGGIVVITVTLTVEMALEP